MESPKKIISAAAITSLSEALTNVYWYKSELRSFLTQILSDSGILSKLNWEDYKRNIVSSLISILIKNQDYYMSDLLRLMNEVCNIRDFSHLERLEEGKKKAKIAQDSVSEQAIA